MIASAEVLDEPTHTMDPRLNFLADHLLSDLHAENVLRIFKTRLGGSPNFSEFFSGTYKSSLPPLAANAQRLATESALEIATGGIVYTHGPGRKYQTDEPLILHVENPVTKEVKSDYYIPGMLGSITEMVSKDGVVDGEFVYNSFGKIVHSSGIALDQCYSYTGREFDLEVGIYYYRARYYDPSIGRFLQVDPTKGVYESPQTLNAYIYVLNSPTELIDPNGEFPLALLLVLVGGAISGGIEAFGAARGGSSTIGILMAFGRGFASGAGATAVGIGVGLITANPFLAGAAAGLSGDLIDQLIKDDFDFSKLDPISLATATALGAVSAYAVSRTPGLRTRGRLPDLFRPRSIGEFGPNSLRIAGQEALDAAVSGAAGGFISLGF